MRQAEENEKRQYARLLAILSFVILRSLATSDLQIVHLLHKEEQVLFLKQEDRFHLM